MNKLIEKLHHFPITSFAVVMGTAGLTIVFGKLYHLQLVHEVFYNALLAIVSLLFGVAFVGYSAKAILNPESVLHDFKHPVRVNFFSAISISFLLLSIAYSAFWPLLALPLWWLGVVLHTFLMFYTISFWIRHNFEIHSMNPAWFIPVVGAILVPVAGVDFMPTAFSFFYFSAGFFFWIILFTIFLNRAVFHHQLAQKFVPTLFILIAPPAVGFISYFRIGFSFDGFAYFLLFLAYFFLIMLFSLAKSFRKIKFFLSWWAFTFPLAAVTIASAVAYQFTGHKAYLIYLMVLTVLTTGTIAIVSYKTIVSGLKGQICVPED